MGGMSIILRTMFFSIPARGTAGSQLSLRIVKEMRSRLEEGS